eukprot:10609965-Ditylum_brightwellii.AAC.1
MSVQQFVNQSEELNALVEYCPIIDSVNPVSLNDGDKCIAPKKAYPHAWINKMTKSNLNFTNFCELVTYYTGLKSVEMTFSRKYNNKNYGNQNNQACGNNNSNNSSRNRSINFISGEKK